MIKKIQKIKIKETENKMILSNDNHHLFFLDLLNNVCVEINVLLINFNYIYI